MLITWDNETLVTWDNEERQKCSWEGWWKLKWREPGLYRDMKLGTMSSKMRHIASKVQRNSSGPHPYFNSYKIVGKKQKWSLPLKIYRNAALYIFKTTSLTNKILRSRSEQ